MSRMTPFELQLIVERFAKADTAWHAQLEHDFGRAACETRYQLRGRGQPDSELRRLYDARMVAMQAFHSAHQAWLKDARAEQRLDDAHATAARHHARRNASIDRMAYAEEAL